MRLLHFYFSPTGRVVRWEWWVKLVLVASLIFLIAASVELRWKFKSAGEVTTTITSTETGAAGTSETTSDRNEQSLWNIDSRFEGTALPIALLLLAYPMIVVTIKRFHDRNKSGWWVLIAFIPVVGALWQLIECGFLPGTAGSNRFGPDPVAKPAMA
jgi:uncharacterized membrane protein YhaH (DUF805 family)